MYNCQHCKELITHEVVHISRDLTHDPTAVERYTEEALQYLQSCGVAVDEIFTWTDQAPTQYKSCVVSTNQMYSNLEILFC